MTYRPTLGRLFWEAHLPLDKCESLEWAGRSLRENWEYERGVEARLDGDKECPYPPETLPRVRWELGWSETDAHLKSIEI